MLIGMLSLFVAKIYLLRVVTALAVVGLLLFIPGPQAFGLNSFQLQNWLSLGLTAFILVHHILMSLYINSFLRLVDLPLLVLEIIGLGFYIPFLFSLYSQHGGYKTLLNGEWQRIPSSNVSIAVSCTTLILLCIELLLQILSLMAQYLELLFHHSSLSGQGPQKNFKPYQIMFGRSLSGAHFRGTGPTMKLSTQYYTSAGQMRFILLARRIIMRAILASSFVSLVLIPLVWPALGSADYLWLALLPFIIFHHLFSCVNVEFGYVLADLPFLVFEITSIMCYIRTVALFDQWSSWPLVGYSFFAWVIFGGLVLEAGIWVIALISYMAQLVQDPMHSGFRGQSIPKPHNVLLGSSLWKTHLHGETYIIRLSRGLMATGFILLIFFSSVLNIILYPVRETGLTPTNSFRSLEVPSYLQAEIPVWNVVFTTPNQDNHHQDGHDADWNSVFQAAVNVTPLWDNSYNPRNSNPSCFHVPEATYDHPPSDPYMLGLYINTVHCPARQPVRKIPRDGIFPKASRDSTRDLLITVNFTMLQIPIATMVNMFNNSLQVIIGFTNDTQKVVDRTEAIMLIPGTDAVGFVTWELRQILKNPILSAFGLFDSYETFVVSRVRNMHPDPLASESPLIPRSRDISTLRVSLQNDISELTTVQDHRTQSALRGFAQVGGLWTFLSGVFAAIFGSSLVRILFGKKPLSFFGLAHFLRRQKIRGDCHEEYPKIAEQLQMPQSERGLVSLICDQLIDLEFLEDKDE